MARPVSFFKVAVGLLVLFTGIDVFAAINVRVAGGHVPGQLVVKLRDDMVKSDVFRTQGLMISKIRRALGNASVLDVKPFSTDKTLHLVKIADDRRMRDVIRSLKEESYVLFAEPNFIYRAFDDGIPNDPDFSKLWGLRNTGQTDSEAQVGKAGADINVLPLWQKGIRGSKKVLVAVIDTGIDWDHPDLKANLYTNTKEADANSSNGKDDDGNGFIDDVHGWDFYSGSNKSRDDHNHGTHVSGTIGAVGNDGVGIVGVNWEASLIPVKFLSADGGGTLQGAVESINYARLMKANIMSNSWGGGGFSDIMKQAIEATRDAGIVFVAAAGNESNNNDRSPVYPATYDVENIVSVAATDNQDKIASFSNFGSKTVHVAAPGVRIYSSIRDGKYDFFSGTSMATPHVSGVIALMLAENQDLTYKDVKERLTRTSRPVRGLKNRVMSKGIVNAYNAVHDIMPPSDDPDESLWKDVARTIESQHPYLQNQNLTFTVEHPGAKYLRIHIAKLNVEQGYDMLTIETPDGEIIDEFTGSADDQMSGYVKGDKLIVRLKTDSSVEEWGFLIDKMQVITSVSVGR
ncbi:MAG: S8 family serine peptidase [Bdellovibrionota bacterium]